jgi:hypothetical protein
MGNTGKVLMSGWRVTVQGESRADVIVRLRRLADELEAAATRDAAERQPGRLRPVPRWSPPLADDELGFAGDLETPPPGATW